MATKISRRNSNSANTSTTKTLETKKGDATMTTIKLTVNLETLTKAQKAALTTLGVSYKKPVEKKEPVKKAAPKTKKPAAKKAADPVKKAPAVKKDRLTIRSTSTDCLVAYNLCQLIRGNKPCDIDEACKSAKARGIKASTAMFKKYGAGKDFTTWCKDNVTFIMKHIWLAHYGNEDPKMFTAACNGRQDLVDSYMKAWVKG